MINYSTLLIKKAFNQTTTLEAGHSIRLGGCGCCGSTSDQKDSHAGLWLIDLGDADASCSVRTRREMDQTAATTTVVELEVQIESCIRGNNPWGWTPFLQGVRSLDTPFYFLSRSTQTAVLCQRNIIWRGEEESRPHYFRSLFSFCRPLCHWICTHD